MPRRYVPLANTPKSEYKIEFIFNYNSHKQEMGTYRIKYQQLGSKKRLLRFIKSILPKIYFDDLYYISACVLGVNSIEELPKWYHDCNGKIHIEHPSENNYE